MIGEEKMKQSLFVDNMIFPTEDPKESKNPIRINKRVQQDCRR